MDKVWDTLTVTFNSSVNDKAMLCVFRDTDDHALKKVYGEQADILYYLLTEQSSKANIRIEVDDPKKRTYVC